MGLSSQHFQRTISGIQQLRPFAKQLDEAGLMLAWISFPEAARLKLTDKQLTYAATQLLLDPDPPRDVPTHLLLLRYLYRLENGQPNVVWGLKADLAQRMAAPSQFHPVLTTAADRLVKEGTLMLDGPRHSPHGVLAGGGQ